MGNISVRMDFKVQGRCSYDYSNYPTDTITCCSNFQSVLYSKALQYTILEQNGVLKYDQATTRWNTQSFTIKKESMNDGSSTILACLVVNRQSSTVKMELMLPMAISAILVVVSPLFGSMLNQVYAKMFALLLQFLCFQFLLNRTPAAGFGDTVPKICKTKKIYYSTFIFLY